MPKKTAASKRADVQNASKPKTESGIVPARSRRVLIVDDEPLVLKSVARVVRLMGYDVTLAADGYEAIERLRARPFDVIVSDVSMPQMDGFELLKRVREIDRRVPVVLATGTPDERDAQAALDLGAFQYLVKPVDPGRLRLVLEQASRGRD
jgi:CheY-like chemotaxis protein